MFIKPFQSFASPLSGRISLGVLFGGLCLWVGGEVWALSQPDSGVTQAERELAALVTEIRRSVPDRVAGPAPLGAHVWDGPIHSFGGNAVAMGFDRHSSEFTLSYDNVPQKACNDFIRATSGERMRSLGLIALYVLSDDGVGKKFCFAHDDFCHEKDISGVLAAEDIAPFCAFSQVTVMFTFADH